ncbi:MAG: hypothetical protein ACKOW8_03265 [Flavobacteriales bacterium]
MNFLTLSFIIISYSLSAQFQHLIVERVSKDKKIGSTYRIYAELKNEGDQLLVVFGDKDHPLNISCDKVFYQDTESGATAYQSLSSRKNNAFVKDSWITISSEKDNHPELQFMGMNCKDFETTGSAISSGQDGAWYILPTSKMSVCGPEKRVLIAQLTTKGNISGILNLMGKTQQGDTWIEHGITLRNK